MKTKTLCLAALILAAGSIPALWAQEGGLYNRPGSFLSFQSSVELGFLGFFAHQIQLGETGTYFDYVNEGGQDVWFPFQRISADISIGAHNRLVFLYQPIDVRTEVLLLRDITVNGANFAADTPIQLRYGFDFYRFSYLYDFLKDPRNELALGASLQIRDAVITFANPNGAEFRDQRNVGPVPALKLRVKYYLGSSLWLGSEVDGIYAAGKGFVGSTEVSPGFVGAILDASLRAGFSPREFLDVFLNLRYLGGGAEGTQTNYTGPGDGYVKNWLNAFSVSLGVNVR
jgi:hypothetical protein